MTRKLCYVIVFQMKDKSLENDRSIVESCIKRDLVAWGIFVKKYSRLVSISIENRAKKYGFNLSRHDVEDIRQDVFTLIWENNKLTAVTNRDDVSYWLSIVSGNMAVDHLRKKEIRQMQNSLSLFNKINEEELVQIIPANTVNPADEAAKFEISCKIDEAIESLPAKEKLIIKMNFIHNKKYHEIAGILGMPNATVSSHIRRAKEKLKENLKNLQQF